MLSKTAAILLGIIGQQPVNAYELNKWLTTMHVRAWYQIASSTVYATLKTAERKGLIEGSTEKTGNMPDKTVYTLSTAGRDALLETLREVLSGFEYDVTGFLIGLFFLNALPAEEVCGLLRKRQALLENYEAGITEQLTAAEHTAPPAVSLSIRQSLYTVQAQLRGTKEVLHTWEGETVK
jgi:DNA-binding PadR family transcriptional regulator